MRRVFFLVLLFFSSISIAQEKTRGPIAEQQQIVIDRDDLIKFVAESANSGNASLVIANIFVSSFTLVGFLAFALHYGGFIEKVKNTEKRVDKIDERWEQLSHECPVIRDHQDHHDG